jgi:ribosomal protein S18 acetylase RimI-like enzyme
MDSAGALADGDGEGMVIRTSRETTVPLTDHLDLRWALPDDPDLDRFTSGVPEVDVFFRGRRWFLEEKGKASPPTYQFFLPRSGEVVGYASVSKRRCGHPTDDSNAKARYLAIYVVGLHERFQGVELPGVVGTSIAAALFAQVEQIARTAPGCVGLYLWVREDNARAVAFYRKLGFVDDTGGPVRRDNGPAHLTMRKLFDA